MRRIKTVSDIKILVIGSISSDIRIFIDSFPPLHCEAIIDRVTEFPGGAGTYFSIFSAMVGFETSMLSKVGGDDIGKRILNLLDRQGIDTSRVSVVRDARTRRLYFMYDKEFRRKLFVHQDNRLEITDKDLMSDFFDCFDFVHVGPVTFDALKKVASSAAKHHRNLILNPSAIFVNYTLSQMKNALRATEIFFVNDAEITLYSGESDIVKGCKKIAKYGPTMIVVTRGASGCLIYDSTSGDTFHVPAVPIKVTDPTGAGDAFAAGFLYEYLRTKDIDAAAKFANATAATLVSSHNVVENPPTLPEIHQLLRFYE